MRDADLFRAGAIGVHRWLNHRVNCYVTQSRNGIQRLREGAGNCARGYNQLATIVSGILYLAADHPPTLDGKALALEFELKIPPTLKLPAQPSVQTLHASLYANDRNNRYALLDYDKIATRDGFVLVPSKASLLSQTFNRDLLVSIEGEGGASQFIKLKLRAKPTKDDEAWSDWMMATERADISPVPEGERIAFRYRVQPEE